MTQIPLSRLRGFLPADSPVKDVRRVRHRFTEALLERLAPQFPEIASSERPLETLGRIYLDEFGRFRVIADVDLADWASRRVIVAFQHPVHTQEVAALLLALDQAWPRRAKGVIVGTRIFDAVMPPAWRAWAREERLDLFPVAWREADTDGRDAVDNGDAVVAASTAWLEQHTDGALLLAPNGISVMWRAVVRPPFRGMEALSVATGTPVLPVAVVGEADLERMRFDLEIRIGAPLSPEPGVGRRWLDWVVAIGR